MAKNHGIAITIEKFFFSEDRNLDLEEEEGKDRRRFSRSYNNKDALGIIEEQVVE